MVNPFRVLRRLRPTAVFCEQEPFSMAAAQWGLAAWLLGIPFGVQMAENLDRRLPAAARVIRGGSYCPGRPLWQLVRTVRPAWQLTGA